MTNTEITQDQAIAALKRDYYRDVLSHAKSLASSMKSGDVEDFSAALHEECDGAGRVIYTFQAKIGLLVSDNEDAAEEEMGEQEARAMTVEQRMFYALQRDVIERLEAGGVDVNNADSWEEIDLSEFE